MLRNYNVFKSLLGEVRTLMFEESDDIWFVANDIMIALGYQNPARSLRDHTFYDDRKNLSYKMYSKELPELWSKNNYKDVTIINESGFYCLAFGSKKPEAIEFKAWVTSVVLPTIRKKGSYTLDEENKKAKTQLHQKYEAEITEIKNKSNNLNADKNQLIKDKRALRLKLNKTQKELDRLKRSTEKNVSKDKKTKIKFVDVEEFFL